MNIVVISGGNGVFSYPLRKWVKANVEIRPLFKYPKDSQWKSNYGNIPLIKTPNLPKIKRVDLVMGHPDCGHSSRLSVTNRKVDPIPFDNPSLRIFLEGIRVYSPHIFVLENLPKFWETEKDKLEDTMRNYTLVAQVGSVTEWGNSQKSRIRLLLWGIDKRLKNHDKIIKILGLKLKKSKPKTTKELIGDLETTSKELCNLRERLDFYFTMYAGYKCTHAWAKRQWLKNPKWKGWPTKNKNFRNAPGVYINRRNDLPKTARKANRQFNYQGLMLSPRELARIQGIPDSFNIIVDESPDKLLWTINKGRTTVTKTPPMELGVYVKNIMVLIKSLNLI